MNQITWKNVVERGDIVGRDIETHSAGMGVFRGPIESIEIGIGCVDFLFLWVGKLDEKTGKWSNWPVKTFWTIADYCPYDMGDDRIQFGPDYSFSIIYPKGNNLDPAKVEGLVL